MNSIFVLLPCYNEEKNIGDLIDSWILCEEGLLKMGLKTRIIGIDDCSTDLTKNIILKKMAENDTVAIIEHKSNKGLSGGLNSAIQYFKANGKPGDYMVIMDGDNTHDPKYVFPMMEKLLQTKADCVIASRYRDGADIKGLAKHREFLSNMAKVYYDMMLNVPNVRDYTCGYRIYTYDSIDRLVVRYGDEPVKEKSFACMMELLYKLYLCGAKFDEVGFELRYDRKRGNSKMQILKTMKNSIMVAAKLRLNKRNDR